MDTALTYLRALPDNEALPFQLPPKVAVLMALANPEGSLDQQHWICVISPFREMVLGFSPTADKGKDGTTNRSPLYCFPRRRKDLSSAGLAVLRETIRRPSFQTSQYEENSTLHFSLQALQAS